MSVASETQVECWNCGEENTVIYGGEEDIEIIRCGNCNEVIGEATTDSLSIPEVRYEAIAIKERHNEFTRRERIIRWFK